MGRGERDGLNSAEKKNSAKAFLIGGEAPGRTNQGKGVPTDLPKEEGEYQRRDSKEERGEPSLPAKLPERRAGRKTNRQDPARKRPSPS